MKANQVNQIYTAKVAELLRQGYQIHAQTMAGSQGEIAHIDLSNGSEIYRVLLHTQHSYEVGIRDYLYITVGKCTDEIRSRGYTSTRGIIWNEHLEVRSQIRLARIDTDWYTTPEEAQPIAALRIARRKNRSGEGGENTRMELGDAYKSVALRWVRRQPRMKSAKPGDLGRMWRVRNGGRTVFEIEVRGKRLTIR